MQDSSIIASIKEGSEVTIDAKKYNEKQWNIIKIIDVYNADSPVTKKEEGRSGGEKFHLNIPPQNAQGLIDKSKGNLKIVENPYPQTPTKPELPKVLTEFDMDNMLTKAIEATVSRKEFRDIDTDKLLGIIEKNYAARLQQQHQEFETKMNVLVQSQKVSNMTGFKAKKDE